MKREYIIGAVAVVAILLVLFFTRRSSYEVPAGAKTLMDLHELSTLSANGKQFYIDNIVGKLMPALIGLLNRTETANPGMYSKMAEGIDQAVAAINSQTPPTMTSST